MSLSCAYCPYNFHYQRNNCTLHPFAIRLIHISCFAYAHELALSLLERWVECFAWVVQKYADEAVEIPRPDNWGGYLVVPSIIEFWHGKKSRLHDRLQYTREGNKWKMERLSP